MHKNNLFRKGLVVGIICILLITTSSLVAGSNNQEESSTSNTIVNYDGSGKCDLVIENVYVPEKVHVPFSLGLLQPHFDHFEVRIKNKGTEQVPGGWDTKSRVTFYEPFEYVYEWTKTGTYGVNRPHFPGQILGHPIWIEPEKFDIGLHRAFFQVDPDDTVDEISEKNNGAWAYCWMFCMSLFEGHMTLGKLHPWDPTKSRTIPRNTALYSSHLLRFLEQFPILQRLLGL